MAFTPSATYYSIDDVTIAIGPILVDGLGEDGGVQFMPDEEYFQYVKGADGKVCRYKMLGTCAKLKITCMRTSATNDQLSAVLLADFNARSGGIGGLPVVVNDRSGRTAIKAAAGWVEGWPEANFTQAPGELVWSVALADSTVFLGGN